MEKIRFSVLIPVYNVELYLNKCIDSVLSQNYKNFEIILVDDGSTDRSGLICDEYSKRYPNTIKVIHKSNEGLISARRKALENVKGEYVCFLDSDDFLDETALCLLSKAIEDTYSDVIVYRWKCVDELGHMIKHIDKPIFEYEGSVPKIIFFKKLLETSQLNSLCLKCCKYSLFDVDSDYSQYYGIQNSEDLLQSLPIIMKARTFFYLDKKIYNYRMNDSSITHAFQKNKFKTLKNVRPLLYDYMHLLGYDDEDNINMFYKKYLKIIWENLLYLYTNNLKKSELTDIFSEILSYDYVQKAKHFIKNVKIGSISKIGLKLFYSNQMIFNLYMRFLAFIIHCRSALRREHG